MRLTRSEDRGWVKRFIGGPLIRPRSGRGRHCWRGSVGQGHLARGGDGWQITELNDGSSWRHHFNRLKESDHQETVVEGATSGSVLVRPKRMVVVAEGEVD